MTGYSAALFLHLLFVLIAGAAAALTTFTILRLRRAKTTDEAIAWLRITAKLVPAFPVSVLGLLVTGGYMTHVRWSWSTPWIDAALVALVLIVAFGSGVEGKRAGMLKKELLAAGLSARARRLLQDPVSWTAKMLTLTLVVAVVYLMTVKPAAVGSAVAIAVALVAGVLIAVPAWRPAGAVAPEGALG